MDARYALPCWALEAGHPGPAQRRTRDDKTAARHQELAACRRSLGHRVRQLLTDLLRLLTNLLSVADFVGPIVDGRQRKQAAVGEG
jgi:hypothetical protein